MLIAAADVLKRYGRWRAPDPARAAAALRAEHAHHREFSAWGSRLRDLREFGAGALCTVCMPARCVWSSD